MSRTLEEWRRRGQLLKKSDGFLGVAISALFAFHWFWMPDPRRTRREWKTQPEPVAANANRGFNLPDNRAEPEPEPVEANAPALPNLTDIGIRPQAKPSRNTSTLQFHCERYRNGGAGVKLKIDQTASSASPSPPCSHGCFWGRLDSGETHLANQNQPEPMAENANRRYNLPDNSTEPEPKPLAANASARIDLKAIRIRPQAKPTRNP